ncbi:MAG: RcnB family protein [Erythrobacter sp.]|nr:RcnB family protein [Erythrobacter sp.]
MKKFISIALALALAFPTAAVAQDRKERNNRVERTQNNERSSSNEQRSDSRQQSSKSHKFAKGERFDRSRAQNYSRVNYRNYSGLSAAPRGYTWVRAGDDALLVRLSNNVVTRVVGGVFR